MYGPIKKVIIKKQGKALIEFWKRSSAEKAYEEYKKKIKIGYDDGLKVKLVIKRKQRERAKNLI